MSMSRFLYSYRNARMWNKPLYWSFRYALTVVSRERRRLETTGVVREAGKSAAG